MINLDFSKKSCFDQSTSKEMSDAELSLTLKTSNTSNTSNQGLFIFILILIVNKFLNKLKCNCFFF